MGSRSCLLEQLRYLPKRLRSAKDGEKKSSASHTSRKNVCLFMIWVLISLKKWFTSSNLTHRVPNKSKCYQSCCQRKPWLHPWHNRYRLYHMKYRQSVLDRLRVEWQSRRDALYCHLILESRQRSFQCCIHLKRRRRFLSIELCPLLSKHINVEKREQEREREGKREKEIRRRGTMRIEGGWQKKNRLLL